MSVQFEFVKFFENEHGVLLLSGNVQKDVDFVVVKNVQFDWKLCLKKFTIKDKIDMDGIRSGMKKNSIRGQGDCIPKTI